MLQSVSHRDAPAGLLDRYGLIVVDECHAIGAPAAEAAIRKVGVERWIGLSATPYRADQMDPIITMQCGPIRHEISDQNALTRHLIVHPTGFTTVEPGTDGASIQAIYGELAEDGARNQSIAADIADSYRRGCCSLTLTNRLEHLNQLANVLTEHGVETLLLHGGLPKTERDHVRAQMSAPRSGPLAVLAIDKVAGVGLDAPRLDTLFLASPTSFKGRVIQQVGRIMRHTHAGDKNQVEVHDYLDEQVPLLERMHRKRRGILTRRGFTIIAPPPRKSGPGPKPTTSTYPREDGYVQRSGTPTAQPTRRLERNRPSCGPGTHGTPHPVMTDHRMRCGRGWNDPRVSEYQYYEFLAVDRPLDSRQQAEVRAMSTRAEITATRFTNEYHWGDFHGDPSAMMERYYDAHLYLANWGTRHLMLRLPRTSPHGDIAPYLVSGLVDAWTTDTHTIIACTSEDEAPEWDDGEPDGVLQTITGVRDELAAGDLRPLYLAWLAAYGTWERDEDAFPQQAEDTTEPPVPPGLATLTPPQQALSEFLRLDPTLLAVAAQISPAQHGINDEPYDPYDLAAWITTLPSGEKDQLLLRVTEDKPAEVQTELLHRFHAEAPIRGAGTAYTRRTVAELLDTTAEHRG